ncbi:MAG: hypothetical protein KME22_22865 [Hassallia sp. WJT32-NPBG1]|jgi:hypothetical protein|nr:hypothetical protein [Hassallia sp. WJT32-NPBG1]
MNVNKEDTQPEIPLITCFIKTLFDSRKSYQLKYQYLCFLPILRNKTANNFSPIYTLAMKIYVCALTGRAIPPRLPRVQVGEEWRSGTLGLGRVFFSARRCANKT